MTTPKIIHFYWNDVWNKFIQFEAYKELELENKKLKEEIEELKEYKWMYEDLCR